jgi:hypothetical protein
VGVVGSICSTRGPDGRTAPQVTGTHEGMPVT